MANQVLLKKSSVAARVPTTSDLAYGEVALNYTDGKLYYKDSSNNINYFLESSQTEATLDDVVTNGSTTTTTAVIPFYYASQSNFPNATTYHGAIAHSHSDGAMYFAHGGSWNKLANDSQLASYQTISGLNAAIDSHLNQSNPTAGYVLSWNGTDYDWVDNAGYADSDVDTHLNTSTASSSQVLYWNGTDYAWASVGALGGGGIQYTDLSVTTASAGTASLSYNNTNGVFTYTPPDLTSYLTDITGENLGDLSNVTLTSPANGQVLQYNGTAWVNAANSGGIALTDLSVTTNSAGTAALSYDNTTGVFSYTPPDLSSYLQSSDIGSTVLAYDSNLQSFVTAFTLPTSDGTANQVLSTDGSGNLTFTTVSSSGGSTATEFIATSDSYTGNNSTTVYALSQTAFDDAHVVAALNGVVQDPSTYSVNGAQITFNTAPALNDNVELRTFNRNNANVSLRDHARFIYTITSTQSSLSGTDDNGITLAYEVGYVDVFQNGIRLVNGDDYTATNGTSIIFTDAVLNGDTVEIVSWGRAYINDPVYQFTENTASLSATTQAVIDQFVNTSFDAVKYVLTAKITGEVHATEVLVMHDGTDVFLTEYGTMWSGAASLGTVSADMNGSNVRLLFTPSNINTTVKVKRISV